MMVKRRTGSRGLFLDLDGTLAESLVVLRTVYFRFLEEYGLQGTDSEFNQLNGPKLAEIVSILRSRYGLLAEVSDLLAIYSRLIDEAYQEVVPLPGAMEVLESAAKRGWTLALVTSNSRARAQTWIARHGFSSFFNSLVTGEEVRRGKPSPDLYEVALSRSGCIVADSIAVEDSPQGARAALAAGLRTFVIRSRIELGIIWPKETEFIRQWKDFLPWI
jgi:mannitol-1-/sugar-/sorbitol-6-phosphatase